jgi:hypothetical protein
VYSVVYNHVEQYTIPLEPVGSRGITRLSTKKSFFAPHEINIL